MQGSVVTVLHSGNYSEEGVTEDEAPEHIVVQTRAELGKAATYATLLAAGAASADNILVTPPPHGGDNESDAQVPARRLEPLLQDGNVTSKVTSRAAATPSAEACIQKHGWHVCVEA